MKEYNSSIEFEIKNNSETKNKLQRYFNSYNFKVVKNETEFIFEKKWSILDGWKLNILNWESKIKIEFVENNKIVIYHNVITCGLGVITPIAFSSLFQKYLDNLEKYLNKNETYERKNIELIRLGRIKLLKYSVILILGILTSFYLGGFLEEITETKIFRYLGIITGILITEKIMNNYLIKNNTLQHHI